MRSIKKNEFYIKSISLIFGMNVLFYFLIKLFISNYHIIGLPIDDKIPFVMPFIIIYTIWYPFQIVSLYCIYKYNKDKYTKTIIAIVIGLLIAYMCFIIYPTTVIRPEVNTFNNLSSLVTYVTFKVDTPVNCFPSAHCLLCFILIFALFKDRKIPLKYRLSIIIINLLIIVSTLLTKQHVVVDVIGALVLAIASYHCLSNLKYFKKIKNQLDKKI